MTDEPAIDDEELRSAARGLLATAQATRADCAAVWSSMVDAGWLGLGVSAQCDGLSQPIATVVTLLEELGRQPCAQPLIAATAAAMMLDLLARGGNEASRTLLAQMLGGRALVVCGPLSGRGVPSTDAAAGTRIGDVPHAAVATHLLLVASCPKRGTVLLACPVTGGVLRVEPSLGWDVTRQYGSVALERAFGDQAFLACSATGADTIAARGRAVLDLALAADALGGAGQILDATVAYMKQRVQFGRPIASFQALKHRAADLATELAAARATVGRACTHFDQGESNAGLRAALARIVAGAAYCTIAEEAVQLHGGIGFTWEHQCHKYLNRARSAETIGGTRAERLDAAAAALLDTVRGQD